MFTQCSRDLDLLTFINMHKAISKCAELCKLYTLCFSFFRRKRRHSDKRRSSSSSSEEDSYSEDESSSTSGSSSDSESGKPFIHYVHSNTNTVDTTYGNTLVQFYKCVAGITISIVGISACIFRKMTKHYTGFCNEL